MLADVPIDGRVPTRLDLPDHAEILRRSRSAQRSVGAVPQRHIVSSQESVHSVRQVFRLQIRELALLRSDFQIEQVVVDLRHQRLQRHRQFNPCRRLHRRSNVPRIHEPLRRRRSRNRRLLKESRRMPGRRHLLDPLPECPPPSHDVKDFLLVTINLDRSWPQKIRRRHQIQKLSLHVFSSV